MGCRPAFFIRSKVFDEIEDVEEGGTRRQNEDGQSHQKETA
jgi:hypothetical protein